MFFEVLPQKRLVGEVQFVADLLDALGGVAQQHAYFQYDIVLNPLVGCSLADLLDYLIEMLGGDAEFFGIPFDTSLGAEVCLQ